MTKNNLNGRGYFTSFSVSSSGPVVWEVGKGDVFSWTTTKSSEFVPIVEGFQEFGQRVADLMNRVSLSGPRDALESIVNEIGP